MIRREHNTPHTTKILWGLGILIILLLAGCRQEEAGLEPELEAVDVAPALEIGTDADQTAVVRAPSLTGVLPEDFPDGLPLYLPASLVDFGTVDDGWVYVNLLTPHSLARVERELAAQLTDSGWSASGRNGIQQLRKGSARARLRVEDARPGTQYRFEYPG